MSLRPPTAYALTFHKISTLLTSKTQKTFPGYNQAQGTHLCRRGTPRSNDWTIHMATALIKRGPCANLLRIPRKLSSHSRFPSLCPARLIRSKSGFGGGAAEGFDARELLHDFFLQEGGRDAAWHSHGVPPEVKQLICSLN